MQSFYDTLFGTSPRIERRDIVEPWQKNAIQQSAAIGSQGLQNLDLSYAPIAQKQQRMYQQQTIPGILNQFSGGNPNSKGSSSLASALAGAGTRLHENLAAGESNYNLQKGNLLNNILQTGLKPTFESDEIPGIEGLLQQFAAPLLQASGKGFGNRIGQFGQEEDQGQNGQLLSVLKMLLPLLLGV